MLEDLIRKNRSYRRFYQDFAVSRKTLEALVDLARLSASGSNLQPLRYFLSCEPEWNQRIFSHLAWAGYLKDWSGPGEGERPSAYIIILGDREITKDFGCDHGIAAQSMMLGAAEKGLGGCMIASIQREKLGGALKIPSRYEILLVLALGKPKEMVVIEPIGPSGGIRYFRDERGVHHVPKRALKDLLLG